MLPDLSYAEAKHLRGMDRMTRSGDAPFLFSEVRRASEPAQALDVAPGSLVVPILQAEPKLNQP